MPDHILPPQAASNINTTSTTSISIARPPTYNAFNSDNNNTNTSLQHKNCNNLDNNDNLSNDDQKHTSHAVLLGVPDRSASASAPPDLEISSRSLFAFKTNYSGIFDIRMDEDYESFYNDNPERMNLPPPLATTKHQNQVNNNVSSSNSIPISSPSPSTQVSQHSIFSSRSSAVNPVNSTNEKTILHQPSANLPPRSIIPSSTTRTMNSIPITTSTSIPNTSAFTSLNVSSHLNHILPRDDSATSLDDLIFRESRQMRPITGSSPGFYRDDDTLAKVAASMQRPATAPPLDDFNLSHDIDDRQPATTVHSAFLQDPPPSNGIGNHFNTRQSHPTGPVSQSLHNHDDNSLQRSSLKGSSQKMSKVLSHMNHSSSDNLNDPSQSQSQNNQHFDSSVTDRIIHSNSSLKRIPLLQEQHQSLQSHSQQHDLDTPLWKLGQLSIDDHESINNVGQGGTDVYGSMPTGYDSSNSRSVFGSTYGSYQQQDPTGQISTAAAAAAAAAMAATQQPSQTTYMQQSIRNHSQQPDWNTPTNTDASRKAVASYEARSEMMPMFPSPAGTTITDMLNMDNGSDSPGNYGSVSPTMAALQYGTPASYRDTSTNGYNMPRNRYVSQHQSPANGRLSSFPGRRNSPLRVENGSESYNYNFYEANNGRHGSYAGTRGRQMPLSPEYVNAQAAAAAAAAAAAVFQSNGVHINRNGSLAPLRPNALGGPIHPRTGNHRSNSRNHESRRNSNGGHQDGYSRGNNGNNLNRGSNHGNDRAILDRSANSNESIGNGPANNLRISSFNDIIGRAEELARDQHGCRYLQTKLEEGNVVYINSIFTECYEKFVDLMTDPFGNYLCQKLFEFCNDAQRLILVKRCALAIPQVSANMHGTRAVQRMVECLSRAEEIRVVCEALRPAAVSLMKDINGNHVIQRCLHRMDPEDNQFVYDAVSENCFELATHRHGCCVMQRCIDYASQTQSNQLVGQITANALPLVKNAFGNYVVQYVLALDDPKYNTDIIRRLQGHLAELSMQKFSSNVVEKSLQLGSRELRRELIDELISDPETMPKLLHDAYGNYVIQKTLHIAEGAQLERICEAIRPHLNSLRQSPFGKRIQAKILKRMPKSVALIPPS